jgi:glycosyltransferase involved in cell wall biosynthesis
MSHTMIKPVSSATVQSAVSDDDPLKRPIRVCFLIDRLVRGGTETQLIALLQHLDRSRVEPYLCLLDGEDDLSRALEPAGVPVLRLGIGSFRSPSSVPKAVHFARFLRRQRIDVLQTYFPDSFRFGVPVAVVAGVRRVVRTRFNLGHYTTWAQRLSGRLLNPLLAATIVNCQACRDSVTVDEWASPDTVVLIPNGIDHGRFAGIPDLEDDPGADHTVRVGMVANLHPVKDPGLLVEAAMLLKSDFPDVRFEFAGAGSLRSSLESAISRFGLDGRICLHGVIHDVPGFLSGLRVAALTSRAEGLPNAVLEYMAAGRAIVATSVGGVPDVICNGVNGLLIPPGDARELSLAIRMLLENPALAARLGRAARADVRCRYSLQVRARRYEQFYQLLLNPGPRNTTAARDDRPAHEERPSHLS